LTEIRGNRSAAEPALLNIDLEIHSAHTGCMVMTGAWLAGCETAAAAFEITQKVTRPDLGVLLLREQISARFIREEE